MSQQRHREIRKTRNYSRGTLISYIIHVKLPFHFSLAHLHQYSLKEALLNNWI